MHIYIYIYIHIYTYTNEKKMYIYIYIYIHNMSCQANIRCFKLNLRRTKRLGINICLQPGFTCSGFLGRGGEGPPPAPPPSYPPWLQGAGAQVQGTIATFFFRVREGKIGFSFLKTYIFFTCESIYIYIYIFIY